MSYNCVVFKKKYFPCETNKDINVKGFKVVFNKEAVRALFAAFLET